MPSNYIKSLEKKGKGSKKELEKKMKDAKDKAKEQGKGENYAYINSIFKKMIHEYMIDDLDNSRNQVPEPSFETIGENPNGKEIYKNWEKKNYIKPGKYIVNVDDAGGSYKKGDACDVTSSNPVKDIAGIPAYEVMINNISVFVPKSFLQLTEDGEGGGGDAGEAGVTTSDVAGYNAPFNIGTAYRTKPDLITNHHAHIKKKKIKESETIMEATNIDNKVRNEIQIKMNELGLDGRKTYNEGELQHIFNEIDKLFNKYNIHLKGNFNTKINDFEKRNFELVWTGNDANEAPIKDQELVMYIYKQEYKYEILAYIS